MPASSRPSPSHKLYVSWAQTIADVLETNWYRTEPTIRWGKEQNSWNTWNTTEALLDYTRIVKDRRYLPELQKIVANRPLIEQALSDGNDDAGWAGIALVKAARLFREKSHLAQAETVFSEMTRYWDDTCGGGVWWNHGRTYKNAITNELFLTLAMLLHRETRKKMYLDWAKREWDWFLRSGMINRDHLINDGLHDCKNNGGSTWTYNQGVILGGLVDLHRATKDGACLEQACRIAGAVMERMSPARNGVAILQEAGDEPNTDQQQFKGIFVRYLATLAGSLPEEGSPGRAAIRQFIMGNADAVISSARGNGHLVNVYWHETERPGIFNAITQTAGLDLLNAAVLLNSGSS
ncbi:MAG: glycoside hydrolase family 76 protein [Capsulimonadales bacterium]|nr:glycoside hydrolase family 76 protein [Capsulimonadales bacterium]